LDRILTTLAEDLRQRGNPIGDLARRAGVAKLAERLDDRSDVPKKRRAFGLLGSHVVVSASVAQGRVAVIPAWRSAWRCPQRAPRAVSENLGASPPAFDSPDKVVDRGNIALALRKTTFVSHAILSPACAAGILGPIHALEARRARPAHP
jgi:hypothetical protein